MARSSNGSRTFDWKFIVTLLLTFFLGICVPFGIHFLERPIKELQVVILADTSLLEIHTSVEQNIKVIYNNKEISNLSLVQVKLENSGNQEVREEDYGHQPIEFRFLDSAEIVDAEVLETSPPNIGMDVQHQQNVAKLFPTLLNRGDQIIIKFLLINMPTNHGKPFNIYSRIAGINSIKIFDAIERKESNERLAPSWLAIFLFFIILLSITFPAWKYLEKKFP